MEPAVGSQVWIERRKWPDAPHYGAEGIVLGEDEYGVWVGARPGNRIYRATDAPRAGTVGVLWCVPRDGWFLAHFLRDHAELDIYIDIAAPAVWDPRGAKIIDLDYDVIVWNDGRPVQLVDEDEFEQHRIELAYPDELAASAREAAARVFELAQSGAPPFSTATMAPWALALDRS
jgi:protein associated with RNAse G/E